MSLVDTETLSWWEASILKKTITNLISLAAFALSLAPARIDAQRIPSHRILTDDARRMQAERDQKATAASVLSRRHTYPLSRLDDGVTARAIGREQARQSLLDELAGLVIDAMDHGRPRPSPDRVKALLPVFVPMEIADERWEGGKLLLQASVTAHLDSAAKAVSLLLQEHDLVRDLRRIRALANQALRETEQMSEGAGRAGEDGGAAERYRSAANQLLAVDWCLKAQYRAYVGRPERALDAYRKAIEVSPGLAVAYKHRGKVYLDLGDEAKAVADFNGAVQAYGSNALEHIGSGEYPACIEDAEAALELSADYAHGYYLRATCRIGLGRQENVTNDLMRAAQLGHGKAQDVLTARGISW